MLKFKDKLSGKRIMLKRTKPNAKLAKIIFELIDKNRKHLKWLAWEAETKIIADTMKYLIAKEKETKLGKKIEYGIYANNQYMGNIGIFDINNKNKSAEMGYWLGLEFTKQGYVTEAVKIIEKEFFVSHKLNRLQIKSDERNKASIAVAKKCKYKLEGKFREDMYSTHFKDFRNTIVFSKLKKEFKK